MEYDFNNKWGLDQQECEWLSGFCHRNGIVNVIEFGPGNSTVAMLNGGAHWIESFEEDDGRAKQLEAMSDKVEIIHYQGKQFPITHDVDGLQPYCLAFIDGPCGSTFTPSRLNAALFCFRRARLLAFHDSNRDQQTINIMLDLGMRVVTRFNSDRGIVVLEHARA
jgi:hypothetical protein